MNDTLKIYYGSSNMSYEKDPMWDNIVSLVVGILTIVLVYRLWIHYH